MSHRPRRAARPRKTLAIAVVAAIVLGAGAWYFAQRNASAEAGTWRTVEVEQGDIRVAISATGDTLALAAPFEDSAASGIGGDPHNNTLPDSGAVYVFY